MGFEKIIKSKPLSLSKIHLKTPKENRSSLVTQLVKDLVVQVTAVVQVIAVVWVQSLVQELPHAEGTAKKNPQPTNQPTNQKQQHHLNSIYIFLILREGKSSIFLSSLLQFCLLGDTSLCLSQIPHTAA